MKNKKTIIGALAALALVVILLVISVRAIALQAENDTLRHENELISNAHKSVQQENYLLREEMSRIAAGEEARFYMEGGSGK